MIARDVRDVLDESWNETMGAITNRTSWGARNVFFQPRLDGRYRFHGMGALGARSGPRVYPRRAGHVSVREKLRSREVGQELIPRVSRVPDVWLVMVHSVYHLRNIEYDFQDNLMDDLEILHPLLEQSGGVCAIGGI